MKRQDIYHRIQSRDDPDTGKPWRITAYSLSLGLKRGDVSKAMSHPWERVTRLMADDLGVKHEDLIDGLYVSPKENSKKKVQNNDQKAGTNDETC